MSRTLDQQFEALLREGVSPDYDEQHGGFVGNQVKCAECGTLNPAEAEQCRDCGFSLEDAKLAARRKTAIKTQDGFEVEPGSGDDLYFVVMHMQGGFLSTIGPFATLNEASRRANGEDSWVVKGTFGRTAARKQAQDGNPYGGGDRANPYFDPGPSQQSGPSYVPAPDEVTRPVTTRPRGGGDAGPDIEDQDTFTEDGQGFDMTEDRSSGQQSAPAAAQASLDKVAVRCADCGQHGKLALSKVNDDLACRCGSTNVDLDDLVPDPDHLALNAIARDIRKANPDLEPERVKTLAKRAHGLAKGTEDS